MEHNPTTGIVIATVLIAAAIMFSATNVAGEIARLSVPTALTDSGIPGQQMNPSSIVYDGKLYVFWASNTAEAPFGTDFDITYTTYDGNSWSQNVVLTPSDTGNDHTPQPYVFNGELYLFWSSSNSAITGGTDADIVVSTFNGWSWSAPMSLTSGFGSTGDYNPFPVVSGLLYVFFEWYSPQSNHYEIGYTRYLDGWEEPQALTESSTGHNLNPTAASTGLSLIVAWETTSQELIGSANRAIVSRTLSEGQWSGFISVSGDAGPVNADPCAKSLGDTAWFFWSTNSESISTGGDFDIVARSYNFDSWNDTVIEISPYQDSGDDTGVSAKLLPDLMAVAWISSSPEYSEGTDTDIIMVTYDRAEMEWSQTIGVSSDDDGREDGGGFTYRTPALSSYEGNLFIIWETNASPSLTVTRNTWLMFAECDFSIEKTSYYWLAIPLGFVVVLVAALIFKRKR
ncbi:MAG: hypothetical protein KKH41_02450 [Candidatus Thermoplasmatota archaeon]|nr:hypothetical protein [Euryarchaeota archaeon]MBU4033110.1 hypothetical protein [Candidatus Thermoplasmatota archaeon]MBU4071508.1 hypothetical protein [Candidatus Thermoplasmatota archaeon]MBU4143429.1 hypothetical protein [Candidatus Thermoplasmatota archaeon]MBU4591423.1 hypothetical protein [Candidatus Thermoplasmatota archaeon]